MVFGSAPFRARCLLLFAIVIFHAERVDIFGFERFTASKILCSLAVCRLPVLFGMSDHPHFENCPPADEPFGARLYVRPPFDGFGLAFAPFFLTSTTTRLPLML
jgi:hypothetical protein